MFKHVLPAVDGVNPHLTQTVVERTEHVADDRAEHEQDYKNNESHHGKDQRIFNEPLTLLIQSKKHNSPSLRYCGEHCKISITLITIQRNKFIFL
jgi:hypothetical protein